MTWTDRHGRPEIAMHPDIKRSVTSYRSEKPVEQTALDIADRAAADSAAEQRSEQAAG